MAKAKTETFVYEPEALNIDTESDRYQLLPPLAPAEYEALRSDIAKRGVQVPVEVTPDGQILDGHNRVAIATELGIDYPYTIREGMDEEARHDHVLKLNLVRRHLDPVSWSAIFTQYAERRGLKFGKGARNDATSATLAEVAAELGVSERTAQRRMEIARGLEAFPDLKQAVQEQRLDPLRALGYIKGGGASTTPAKATIEQAGVLEQAIAEDWTPGRFKYAVQAATWEPVEDSIVLPGGKFQLLYADPPWPTAGGSKANYPTMSIGAIESLSDADGRPVADLPEDNAILFMWAVNEYLEGALSVMRAWGFTYRSNVVWDKEKPMGLGAWVRQRHELLLIGTRGSFPHPHAEDREDSVIAIAKGRHSEKPAFFREWMERMYGGTRKVELFARVAPEGWAIFGNQAPAGEGS